ncbi:MAG: flagellar hook assembly protein FlgD [Alphaproteobacteria bacterium]|jgi:flagellar basal-body rod modification protein FlgD|uniref:flagellar hook assembly protein FlgD n=1 Tax=Devosia sp. XGJD_8 TaxID=3391187 RepID=UPI001E0E85D2|nr:flagellar hook assembly protein FlgD [Alphaproteobacteria bacterium]MBU1560196.1 flagellar hook assembly protein FlgD [Alphaproteobacteria bacterium]MBU2303797.1 flagellar hook assembly protein FlgD [Alphaproteobacteria bacterium]MBU2369384.1 flagellar hook assembly protein FlgD [Alphaproteobacteria bacterium]
MAVDGVSGTSTSQMSSSRATIADNFDTFLSILTTQLKNQNPLDPMDTNQFTQQLVQFTGVEQQLKTNEFLETLMLSGQNTAKSDAVSYIGKEVTSSGKTGELTGSNAAFWAYSAEANAANATITIKDASGQTVYNQTGPLQSGPGTFRWDGKGSDGNMKPNGIYTIDIKGKDANGKDVKISTASIGIVTAVDFTGDVPVLTVGSRRVTITDVTDVRIPDVTAPVEDDDTDTAA